MIRYEIGYEELAQRVENLQPGWTQKAMQRTAIFRRKKRFDDGSPIWSEVKPVFMDLQQSKCAYCERKLESSATGTIEWDVEHYRPKSRVRRWNNQETGEGRIPGGYASKRGYYLLPYHLLNYLASCKVCNTRYKSDYFPVRGRRGLLKSDPRGAPAELALLPYPIGDFDEDPEDILSFQGFVCVPRHSSGPKRERALITINFFELNGRDTLLNARAELVVTLFGFLRSAPQGPEMGYFRRAIGSGKNAHSNCGRAFLSVYAGDPVLASEYASKAMTYLQSKGG